MWLSIIVLLPLAAIAWQASGGGWQAFWLSVTSRAALDSLRVTLTISAGITLVNTVFGLLIAWVLVRDDFVGKRLVDAIIDLPFALPTIVASLVMLALYGPTSPVGLQLQHTAWGWAWHWRLSPCRSWCAPFSRCCWKSILRPRRRRRRWVPPVPRSSPPWCCRRCCRRCCPVRALRFRGPSGNTARSC
ncbi:sulfate ABC superfamily ATP binding cassette transporter, membrane protein [Mycobacterium kansasii 824]|nr:sulfate ABC superfamily ATP binding cassette transporter, membrane protein [Mycobacterium kansasii 824]